MRKYYPGLTLFKITGAVLVLLTHVRSFPLNDELNAYVPGFSALCSVVVPGFYVMAGFLAAKGWMRAARPEVYIRQYVTWIGRAYLLFCVLHFFTDPLSVVRTGTFAHHRPQYYIEPFLLRGPYPQMWFILPLLVAVVLGYWAERRRLLLAWGMITLLGFGLAVSVLGTLQDLTRQATGDLAVYHHKYWGLVDVLLNNYLGYALPFVFIGICAAKYEEGFGQLRKWYLIGPALACSLAELTLVRWLYPHGYPRVLMFAQLPLTILLFYGLLHVRSPWVQPYHGYLRRLSMFLFFTHWPLIRFNLWLLSSIGRQMPAEQTALCIGLTFGQILLLERAAAWWQQKRKSAQAVVLSA